MYCLSISCFQFKKPSKTGTVMSTPLFLFKELPPLLLSVTQMVCVAASNWQVGAVSKGWGVSFRLQPKIPQFLVFLRLKEIKGSRWKTNLDLPFLQEQLGMKRRIHGIICCSPVRDICLRVRSPKYPVLFAYFVQWHFTLKYICCPSAWCPVQWATLLFIRLYTDRR